MTAQIKDNEAEGGAKLSPAGFDDPVEFIHREHDRQIIVLGAIERLAEAPGADDARETAAYALDYLARELPLHLEDKERDLFPRLAERVTADDGFDDILAALRGEHQADDAYCRALMADCTASPAGAARRSSGLRAPGPCFCRIPAPPLGAGEQCSLASGAPSSRCGRFGRFAACRGGAA